MWPDESEPVEWGGLGYAVPVAVEPATGGAWDWATAGLTKALDYLIVKDSIETRAALLPLTAPQQYYRAPSGAVLPVGGAPGGALGGNNMLLLIVGAVVVVMLAKS